jgi:hypothetical protein
MIMRGLIVLLAGVPALASGKTPPKPLQCLQRFYAVKPVEKDGSWYAITPDGQRYMYDFGSKKSFEQMLEVPDVEDMFSIRYRKGPIAPVTSVDDDPGRIRHEPVFAATYPDKELVQVKFLGFKVKVQQKITAALERVARRLDKARAADPKLAPFLAKLGAAWADRRVAGTNRPTAHSYGIALDLNPELSTYWRWQKPPEPVTWASKMPQAIVDAFEAEGFAWGGRWYHYDTAHFEYRPELLDPTCYE